MQEKVVKHTEDLWIRAGGEQRVIKELLDLGREFGRETPWSSEVWPELSIRLFAINRGGLRNGYMLYGCKTDEGLGLQSHN